MSNLTSTDAEDPGEPLSGGMIRSEEELHVAVQLVEAGRARLVKRVSTETVTRTIEVRREVLEIETIETGTETETHPVDESRTDANLSPASTIDSGPFASGSFQDGVLEIVLMQEEPLVTVQNVPRERIRLAKRTVIEEQAFNADLAVERVDVEQLPPETV